LFRQKTSQADKISKRKRVLGVKIGFFSVKNLHLKALNKFFSALDVLSLDDIVKKCRSWNRSQRIKIFRVGVEIGVVEKKSRSQR